MRVIQQHPGVWCVSDLRSLVLGAAHQREVEASAQLGLEEEGRAAAAEAAAGDDGHSVAQQVRLVHVVRGQDHRAPCGRREDKVGKVESGGKKN